MLLTPLVLLWTLPCTAAAPGPLECDDNEGIMRWWSDAAVVGGKRGEEVKALNDARAA